MSVLRNLACAIRRALARLATALATLLPGSPPTPPSLEEEADELIAQGRSDEVVARFRSELERYDQVNMWARWKSGPRLSPEPPLDALTRRERLVLRCLSPETAERLLYRTGPEIEAWLRTGKLVLPPLPPGREEARRRDPHWPCTEAGVKPPPRTLDLADEIEMELSVPRLALG